MNRNNTNVHIFQQEIKKLFRHTRKVGLFSNLKPIRVLLNADNHYFVEEYLRFDMPHKILERRLNGFIRCYKMTNCMRC